MHVVVYLAVAFLAYLLGSIPTGYLAGRWRGLDIRSVGSGNIGATNVFRALGVKAGITVLVLDVFKGFAACRFLPLLGDATAAENLRVTAGLSAILGHNYTCWLRFRGGKGIATSAGVFLGLMPISLAIVLVVWLLILALSRYVSLASISAACALPLVTWLTNGSRRMILISAVVGGLAIYKHRANIRRLLEGTEPRFRASAARQSDA